jgi:hypothetical protein
MNIRVPYNAGNFFTNGEPVSFSRRASAPWSLVGWFGLVWSGLVGFGLVGFGLVGFGLLWSVGRVGSIWFGELSPISCHLLFSVLVFSSL